MHARSLRERRRDPEDAVDEHASLILSPAPPDVAGDASGDGGEAWYEADEPVDLSSPDDLVDSTRIESRRTRLGVLVVGVMALLGLGVVLLTDAGGPESTVEAVGSATTLPSTTASAGPTSSRATTESDPAGQSETDASGEATSPTLPTQAAEGDDAGATATGDRPSGPLPTPAPDADAPGRANEDDQDGRTQSDPSAEAPPGPTPTDDRGTEQPEAQQPAAPDPPPAAPTGSPGQGAAVWSYYGNPWVPSHLANLTVRGNERYSYRFVAKRSGVMTGFQNYMQANTSRTGYGGGDGGSIRFRLVPDDGSGRPNESTVLAEVVWSPNLNNGSGLPPGSSNYTDAHPTYFADKYWPSRPTLTAGATYHLVIENIDPNSSSNYISINNPYAINGRPRSPLGPQVADWGVMTNRGGTWSDYTEPHNGTRYEVNLMVLMEDGNHYGNSYMDSRSAHTISGGNGLRQVFTPSRTVSVDQLSVFTSGSGVLRATLRQGDTTVGTWSASVSGERHSVFDTGSIQLASGASYSLEFSAESGSFDMLTFRDGAVGNGYPYPQGGSWEGHAQLGGGGSWSNAFFTYADVAGVVFRTR